jgi:hypothetical protein
VLLLVCGYGVCLVLGWLCVLLLIKIGRNEINLNKLVSEANGDASMSRFQLLIFTMIVSISLFIMVVKNWSFPPISDGILTLLGISASTYAVSKGIQFSRPETLNKPEDRQQALDTAEKMSDTGAPVIMTPSAVISGGAPAGNRAPAAPQTPMGNEDGS